MSSSRANSLWPHPENPEAVFGAVLLECGLIPEKGWRITRNPAGEPTYICAGTSRAGLYQKNVVDRCWLALLEQIGQNEWSSRHIYRIAQMWKNMYLLWLFKEIEK